MAGAGERPGIAQRPTQLPANQRENWNNWSQGRGDNWNQAVNNRENYWNNWSGSRQENLNDFRQNQDQRWDNVQGRYENREDWFGDRQDDRQEWRADNREDWQDYREDMWDYRWDRADDVWDNVQDYHDDLFDDYWWRSSYWGGSYYSPYYDYDDNPWWWWVPTAWNTFSSIFTEPEPIYYDYGVTVIYEDDQVYQNGQPPVPVEQYNEIAFELADVEAPPPVPAEPSPAPAEPSQEAATQPAQSEWMPLGVWALTQEEKGDAIMFFQISVNREGVISGGYQNVMTDESMPISGSVDKATQRAAWHIGDNKDTVIETGIYNLTQDVTPVLMHFGKEQTQTWMMVRLPAPQMPDSPTAVDTAGADRQLPPVMGAQ